MTTSQMPSHNHPPNSLSRFITTNRSSNPARRDANPEGSAGAFSPGFGKDSDEVYSETTTGNRGSNQAHENRPPSKTAYLFKRTV